MLIAPLYTPLSFKGIQYGPDDPVSNGIAIEIDSDIWIDAELVCQVLGAIMVLPKSIENGVLQVGEPDVGDRYTAKRRNSR